MGKSKNLNPPTIGRLCHGCALIVDVTVTMTTKSIVLIDLLRVKMKAGL